MIARITSRNWPGYSAKTAHIMKKRRLRSYGFLQSWGTSLHYIRKYLRHTCVEHRWSGILRNFLVRHALARFSSMFAHKKQSGGWWNSYWKILPKTSLLRCALSRDAARYPNASVLKKKYKHSWSEKLRSFWYRLATFSRTDHWYVGDERIPHPSRRTDVPNAAIDVRHPIFLLLLFLTFFTRHCDSFPSDIRQQRPTKTHYLQLHSSNFFSRKTHCTLLFRPRELVEHIYRKIETPLKPTLKFATFG